jgi:hypothetical protein
MKKVLFLTLLLAFWAGTAYSQVRIGKLGKPVAGAVLDLQSAPPGNYVGGLVLPRVEITAVNAIPDNFIDKEEINPSELAGLMVYNTHESAEIPKGVYVWSGTKWTGIN